MKEECNMPPVAYTVTYISITRPVVTKINKSLSRFVDKTYYNAIPINLIEKALEENGFSLVNEDGTKFSSIFCGEDGRAKLDFAITSSFDPKLYGIGAYGKIVSNSSIILSWYKMANGKYEITVYAS